MSVHAHAFTWMHRNDFAGTRNGARGPPYASARRESAAVRVVRRTSVVRECPMIASAGAVGPVARPDDLTYRSLTHLLC